MKPLELEPMGQKNLDGRPNFSGYSEAMRIYQFYRNTECVIAYRKCFMGTAFLIQGKRDMFAFIFNSKFITRWESNVPELQRKSLRTIKLLFQEPGDDKMVVLDENAFKLFERKVLFATLTQ